MDGAIQTELFFKFRALLGGGFEGQHDFDGIAHQAGHDKNQHGDPQDHPATLQETLEKITAQSPYFTFISLTSILASTRPGQASRLLTP